MAPPCFARLFVACLTFLLVADAVSRTNPAFAGAQDGTSSSGGDAVAATRPGTAPTEAGSDPTGPGVASTGAAPALRPEQLDQAVAPVALYPDSLLAQVLMAATYPLEVVQAERWVKQNPTLKGSAAELNKLTWDPSVKSLIDFPQVLAMMSERLDWTVKLGDAFLADRKGVMDAVQRLRRKAQAEGNLKTTKEQKVTVEQPPATQPAAPPQPGAPPPAPPSPVILVESTSPSVVYVPTYNPTVVYGAWPYPAYPPYYYTPPGYAAGAALVGFGVGVAVGAAWGHAWGHCNWHGGDVDIDVNRNVNFNQNINRNSYNTRYNNVNNVNRSTTGARSFQHDASHRKGVAYRDAATTERYRGAGASRSTAQARESYRGRAEAGRQELARGGGSDGYRGSGSGGYRTSSDGYRGSGSGSGRSASPSAYRDGGGRTDSQARASGGQGRDYSGTRSSGFSGSDYGGAGARSASSRGQSSRSSYSSSGSRGGGYSGGYSGGSRGGYSGGGRAGGGRGGGGRR